MNHLFQVQRIFTLSLLQICEAHQRLGFCHCIPDKGDVERNEPIRKVRHPSHAAVEITSLWCHEGYCDANPVWYLHSVKPSPGLATGFRTLLPLWKVRRECFCCWGRNTLFQRAFAREVLCHARLLHRDAEWKRSHYGCKHGASLLAAKLWAKVTALAGEPASNQFFLISAFPMSCYLPTGVVNGVGQADFHKKPIKTITTKVTICMKSFVLRSQRDICVEETIQCRGQQSANSPYKREEKKFILFPLRAMNLNQS